VHETRRVSGRDGGGGAVGGPGITDQAALTEGRAARRPALMSDRRDVAHLQKHSSWIVNDAGHHR
jgi:hypothetical protein